MSMHLDTVNVVNLRPADWRAGYILAPDQRLLSASIADHGWLVPIVARVADGTIIDGFARWWIAGNDKRVLARDRGDVPVQWVDCDEITAKVLHVRLNRARGSLVPGRLAPVVQQLVEQYGATEVRQLLMMHADEVEVMVNPSLLKRKKLVDYEYSKAWVPVEAAPGAIVAVPPSFEKPPNPDR